MCWVVGVMHEGGVKPVCLYVCLIHHIQAILVAQLIPAEPQAYMMVDWGSSLITVSCGCGGIGGMLCLKCMVNNKSSVPCCNCLVATALSKVHAGNGFCPDDHAYCPGALIEPPSIQLQPVQTICTLSVARFYFADGCDLTILCCWGNVSISWH